MHKKLALEIAQGYNLPYHEVCDRCGTATTRIYGWAGMEALCMACFITVNLEFDEDGEFTRRLEQCTDTEDLIALCEDYSL